MSATLSERFRLTGPLPPPAVLQGYADVQPGLDARIVQWTEEETRHRREMERSELDIARAALRDERVMQRLGMVSAFTVTMTFAGIGAYAIYLGRDLAGAATLVTALIGVVSVFVVGSRRRKTLAEELELEGSEPTSHRLE